MVRRINAVKNSLEDKDYIADVMLDEEFIPPHKSAAFTPYDCIICVDDLQEGSSVVKDENYGGEERLDEIEEKIKHDLSDEIYHEVVGVVYNDTGEAGDILVYISLESFEEYKSRW